MALSERFPIQTKPVRPRSRGGRIGAFPLWLGLLLGVSSSCVPALGDAGFFEEKVVPILKQHCYECHSHAGKIKGGLALDSTAGLTAGGEGGVIVVPGSPETSRLISAVQHTDPDLRMPPAKKISEAEISVLVEWVRLGAGSRIEASSPTQAETVVEKDWEEVYQERLKWWSLQQVAQPSPPEVKKSSWVRNDVDRFILAELESKGLSPVREADRLTLARRLSFVLTGLPPDPEMVERFTIDPSPTAYSDLVQSLLDSPHFGERWARHWMDVVHYADTHGYEWDTPAKNAWMYRDYLIRAFNEDVPFNRLIMEQIAGDLIEPRIDPKSGVNESLIGLTAMRLGERRHGDNADAEGVTQEAVANIIDTLSKGFLGTTVACAQCHDHKLDAVEQKDYYGLAGVLMSSRWIVRSVDTEDPNLHVIAELRDIKKEIRAELGAVWNQARESATARIRSITASPPEPGSVNTGAQPAPDGPAFPETLAGVWKALVLAASDETRTASVWNEFAERYPLERDRRVSENQANLTLAADFTREEIPAGWRVDGLGMKHGLVDDGELILADAGNQVAARIAPAGRWSDVWSARLAGAVRSPLFGQNPPPTVSVGHGGGQYAAQSIIVDHAFHSERMKFLKQPGPTWLTFTAGRFPALAGEPDPTPRRVYLELVTKAMNNYFPPRSAFGGVKEEDERDPRSWFGVTRVYLHPAGKPPLDELERFESLFTAEAAPRNLDEAAARMADAVMRAVDRWSREVCDAEDVRVLNEALAEVWIPNAADSTPRLARLTERYRETERRIQPDRVIGAVDDWGEGKNERIGVRGSYTVFGEEVPRGNIRFLGGAGERVYQESSGRLELARNFAANQNPLTARVYVNRVWHYVFGAGIVRTVDDFGQLGERPSHPELLDWLATRFIEEGWSTKRLITQMVESATWRQGSRPNPAAIEIDPENRLWHHMPMRRLEAESIRDAILAAADRLDRSLYGPPIDPSRTAEDPAKRLYSGPLDGDGRRSLYLKMTLMEPPRFLALFNQPIPKLTTGRRDATNVPDQALALLNDPFVNAMAERWGQRVLATEGSPGRRIETMFAEAFGRPPNAEETRRLIAFASRCAELHGSDPSDLLECGPVWKDVAHAIFNLKEFIYVP